VSHAAGIMIVKKSFGSNGDFWINVLIHTLILADLIERSCTIA
jgi:hypothetical protein